VVVLLFAIFLPAASADSADLAPQTKLCAAAKQRFHFWTRAAGARAKLSEFWCETLPVVSGIRHRMTKAIFPYVQRYQNKRLTGAGANIVLAT